MASGFPGSIDSFTNPLTTSPLNSPSHAGQHQDLNDAANKIETYMGLVKVAATVSSTGGTAATASSTGTITVGNGNTAVTITAFSALYKTYRIVFQSVTTSTNPNLQFNLDGATTSYYGSMYYDKFDGTSTGTSRINNGAFLNVGIVDTDGTFGTLEVNNPFAALKTNVTSAYYGSGWSGWCGGIHNVATSYAAFRLTPSGGTFTGGTIVVYGYRN